MAKQNSKLEESFAKLDDIAKKLEDDTISLEESFALYQEGMKLLKLCNDSIDKVEKKIIMLEQEGV